MLPLLYQYLDHTQFGHLQDGTSKSPQNQETFLCLLPQSQDHGLNVPPAGPFLVSAQHHRAYIHTSYPPQNTRTSRSTTVSWAVPSCHSDRHHWFGGGRDGLGSGEVYPCTGLYTLDNHTAKRIPHDTIHYLNRRMGSIHNKYIN